jgi:hypothetical protein
VMHLKQSLQLCCKLWSLLSLPDWSATDCWVFQCNTLDLSTNHVQAPRKRTVVFKLIAYEP